MPSAVFFDRDDTLIRCRDVAPGGDLGDPDLVDPMPGAAESVQLLKKSGFRIVVVSNQGGVARGSHSIDDVNAVNSELNRRLGGAIDAFYFCPHHPQGSVPRFTGEHPNRKPAPGMLLQAAEDLDIDLSESWMIGDTPRDCRAGRAAGARTILVPRPELARPGEDDATDADFVTSSLLEAADIVLRHSAPAAGRAPDPPARP